MIWKYLRLASTWYASLLLPVICCGQPWEKFSEGVISCHDRAAIVSAPGAGISYVSIDSGRKKWQAMSNNPPNRHPVLAGDTVAVVADSFNTIYAFSKTTGRRLWTMNVPTSVLASDGNYFYIIRTGYWKLQALDPASGSIAWSLQLPNLGPGYLNSLPTHNGLLFVIDLVIDISKRALVHRLPEEPFYGDVMALGDDGNIFVADTSGMIAIYDKNFNRLRKLYAGKGYVVELSSTREQILARLQQSDSYGERGMLVSLTLEGKRLWRIQWSSPGQGFTIVGRDVLVIEPGKVNGEFRLMSRQLSTGKVNWTTESRALYGTPALCDSKAYVTDGHRLRSFDVHTGKETTAGLFARH